MVSNSAVKNGNRFTISLKINKQIHKSLQKFDLGSLKIIDWKFIAEIELQSRLKCMIECLMERMSHTYTQCTLKNESHGSLTPTFMIIICHFCWNIIIAAVLWCLYSNCLFLWSGCLAPWQFPLFQFWELRSVCEVYRGPWRFF